MNYDNPNADLYSAEGKAEDVLKLITSRRAFRKLSSKAVSGDTVKRVLEAARWAPSCGNNQPWRYFVAIGDQAKTMHEALVGGNYWAKAAPVYIAATVDRSSSCNLNDNREYALLDLGFSMQNLFLQAHAEGLAAHPMAGIKPTVVKELFSIPENFTVMAVISLSYLGDEIELSEKHAELEGLASRNSIADMLHNPEVLDSL